MTIAEIGNGKFWRDALKQLPALTICLLALGGMEWMHQKESDAQRADYIRAQSDTLKDVSDGIHEITNVMKDQIKEQIKNNASIEALVRELSRGRPLGMRGGGGD